MNNGGITVRKVGFRPVGPRVVSKLLRTGRKTEITLSDGNITVSHLLLKPWAIAPVGDLFLSVLNRNNTVRTSSVLEKQP